MNFKKRFVLFLLAIPAIAVLDAAAGLAGIKTHFYLWELLIDGRTVMLAAAFILLLKPADWRNDARERGVFTSSIRKNAAAFMIPALLAGLVVGAGLLLKKVAYADPENGATLLLTMAFDIPAIFIFSVTTIFVEEYVFRGWILSEFSRNTAPSTGLMISSVLWTLYAIVDVLPLEEFTWAALGILVLFYLAVGFTSGTIYYASRSLWLSYSFRIGIVTITPSILSGVTGATDAFFSTENIFFFGDGIAASGLLLVVSAAWFFFLLHRKKGREEAVKFT